MVFAKERRGKSFTSLSEILRALCGFEADEGHDLRRRKLSSSVRSLGTRRPRISFL
jgi:hypothetical protein